MLLQMTKLPSFFKAEKHFLCTCITFPLSTERPFSCFHILATMNSTRINMELQTSLPKTYFSFFDYIPRSRIAVSYGNSIFHFWGKPPQFSKNRYNLHSPSPFLHIVLAIFLLLPWCAEHILLSWVCYEQGHQKLDFC